MELNKVHKAVLDNMNEQVYVRDLEMKILYINPASESLTGWSLREASGKKCYEVFGDEKETCKEVCPVEKAISEGLHIFHHEGTLKTRSGDLRKMQVSISPLYEDEAVIGAAVVMEDITRLREVEQTNVKTVIALEKEMKSRVEAEEKLKKHRDRLEELVEERTGELTKLNMELKKKIEEFKRAEEALRESEEKYRLLVENTIEGIMVIQDGKAVFSNPRTLDYGYSPDELHSMPFIEFIHPDDRQGAVERYLKMVSGQEVPGEYEFRVIAKSGSVHWISSNSVMVEWNRKPAVLTFLSEITERKQMEAALRESEKRYRNLFESSKDGIGFADLEGRIIDCNRAILDMLGYSIEELRAVTHDDITPEKWRGMGADIIKNQVMQRGYSDEFEKELIRKDGTVCPISIRVWAIKDDPGKPTGMWVMMRDLTEQKRAEEALRDAREELIRREKLAVLGQLAGGMAHELRNPLGVISNAVYFLQMTLTGADGTTKEYLEIIASEIGDAEKIISDLLDFSRTSPAEREDMAITDLVDQALKKRPPPENVKVTIALRPDLPAVFVDPRQVGQVLDNLIANACQAMPEGGSVGVEAGYDQGKVYLSVTDTGCGIPKEKMDKIFDPLFTTRARGIGLGLTLSKNLVQANGGRIEVESEEGRGSTFTLILPTKEALS